MHVSAVTDELTIETEIHHSNLQLIYLGMYVCYCYYQNLLYLVKSIFVFVPAVSKLAYAFPMCF